MKVKKEEISAVAKEVLQAVEKACTEPSDTATIVALRGNLGAGKTTFTQAIATELGIEDAVQSPTYVLMKSYPINFGRFKTLIHIDAYRFETPEEFSALEPEKFLSDSSNLVFIEWPERVEPLLPTPNIVINFSSEGMGDDERYIEVV